MGTDPRGEQPPQTGLPLRLYTCNRVGLQANPPGQRGSIGDWLRRRANGGEFHGTAPRP